MKILHTSDWHLGASEGEISLVKDQLHFVDEICSIVENENIDVVIIAGDIYDKSIASAQAIESYDYAVTRLCIELKKKVIVIAGNHDSASRISGCRELLKNSGLYVCGVMGEELNIVHLEDTDFYLFPYFTEEKIKGLYPDKRDNINCLTDAYRIVCDQAAKTFDKNKRHIAIAHAFITNSTLSGSDKAAGIAAVGTALSVNADVFNDFDYVALGHIHGPQNINDRVRYSGTPMAYSFGREENQEKSVTIIDTKSMKRAIIPLHPLHKRSTLKGTFEELSKGSYDEATKNGYIRLDVTDIYVGLEGLSILKEVYPRLMEIKCKSYEGDNVEIRMTIDEFREMESDPRAVFLSFCQDVYESTPDEHLIKLFEECIKEEEDR